MKKIFDINRLNQYIEEFELNSIFEKDMIEHMELFCFSKGDMICTKDNYVNYVYFLVEGKIKVYTLHDNGKSILLRFSNPLSILGDVELLSDYKGLCNVESVTETFLIGIEIVKLKKYAYNDTKFLRFVIKNLSYKLYNTSNATSINLLYPLESRFASYLLSISGEGSSSSGDDIRTSKLTEIANLLGTSYRHLNRIINEFVNKDIIIRKRGTIIIKDFHKLKELSSGNIYE
ncbi:cyclic nucleotide-binding domain-containing protein [Clostridium sp. CX1]|uniref:Cyclic nucleotide-binding domain-containing protein n=1 Tax=Clostridium tanneri TaxID=3037988 RepID=A0ABU4JYW8_9CLOT|nr:MULTISPECIES: cyclic nucleotide-binding domain-containing protein [unclassified Clostridium]MCT8978814.1 cyclic nucleotide-binding domain-containing protein [Clostridium sp. CX1]MDW8803114.1 cyclic nucleotide-binding domain-containing protein [Clostridium sp. A1-XYC3]